jgi:membrane protein implicated in regulation of membrane protease activity
VHLGDSEWLLWLALAIGAGIVEVLSLDLVFLMIAGGAVAAAIAAALGAGLPVELLVFALTSGVLLLGARPPLLRYVRDSVPHTTMNTAALVGREAEVLVEVSTAGGRVKLAGEVWSARAVALGPGGYGYPLEVGSTVQVVRIDGATAVVAPLTPRAGLTGAVPPDGPGEAQ